MQYPTSAVLSPTPSPTVVTEGTSLAARYNSSGSVFAAVPVAVVLVVILVLGAFRAHAWRRNRAQAGDRGSRSGRNASSAAVRTTARGRDTAAVLIEETDSEEYADVWGNIDFTFWEGEQSRDVDLSPQTEHEAGSDSSSSASDTPILCTVEAEVHTDPAGHRPMASCSRDSDKLLLHVRDPVIADLNELSQMQDLRSSSTTTIVSPSHHPGNTSNDTSSTVANSAQEIVEMIQSEGLMLDSSVLQSGSSEFSLFTGCEGRKHAQEQPSNEEQLIISLSEIDSPQTLWEDWEEELSTVV